MHKPGTRNCPFFFFNIDILYKSLIPEKLATLHKPQAESCQVVRTLILIQKNSYAHAQLWAYGSLTDLWAWNLLSFQQRELQRTHFATKEARKDWHWLNTLNEREQKVHRVERPAFFQVSFERLLLYSACNSVFLEGLNCLLLAQTVRAAKWSRGGYDCCLSTHQQAGWRPWRDKGRCKGKLAKVNSRKLRFYLLEKEGLEEPFYGNTRDKTKQIRLCQALHEAMHETSEEWMRWLSPVSFIR